MSKLDKNNKAGPDVLRAIDVIPPFDKPHVHPQSSQQTGEDDCTNGVGAEHAEPALPPQLLREAKTGAMKADIPKFDLAAGLLAGRREVSAAKRKSPVRKAEDAHRGLSAEFGKGEYYRLSALGSPQQRLIIADIVAGDIERLCRGDAL